MNKSYTKKRRISEANEKLEKRYLGEQGLKNIFTKNKPETSSSPTRKNKNQWDSETNKGVQEIDGMYTCTSKGTSSDMNFAKEIAQNQCKNAIMKFLGKTSATLSNTQVEDESVWKNTNGSFDYYVTIKIDKTDIS